MVKIIRKNALQGCLRNYEVVVNNKVVGSLANGQTKNFNIKEDSLATIYLKQGRKNCSNKITINLKNKLIPELICEPKGESAVKSKFIFIVLWILIMGVGVIDIIFDTYLVKISLMLVLSSYIIWWYLFSPTKETINLSLNKC